MKANSLFGATIVVCGIALSSLSAKSETVQEAFQAFLDEPYFRGRRSAGCVVEFGVPDDMRNTQTFGTLVTALSNDSVNCFANWKSLATNELTRMVFRTALAESGPDVYTILLTNMLFTANGNSTKADASEIADCISPACTRLENYYMLNYVQPGISNLWLRARVIFSEGGRSVWVSWVDEVLSGERRWMYDHLDSIDYGLGARPKPYKDGTW